MQTRNCTHENSNQKTKFKYDRLCNEQTFKQMTDFLAHDERCEFNKILKYEVTKFLMSEVRSALVKLNKNKKRI